MHYPTIEFRERDFFILSNFEGNLDGVRVVKPHNRSKNLTRYIVDSSGKVWSFNFDKDDGIGIRKLLSIFWNYSHDYYSVQTTEDKTVKWLKERLIEYKTNENPDIEDLANCLLDSLATLDDEKKLSNTMNILNL